MLNLSSCAGSYKLWAQKPYYNGYVPLGEVWAPTLTWASDEPTPPEQQDRTVEVVCRRAC